MLPFVVRFQSGAGVYDQILMAVKTALATGRLASGDRFPSVRSLSQELRISPNMAHRIVSTLVEEGVLRVQPGVGTVVTEKAAVTAEQRRSLVEQDVERLVGDARMVGLDAEDLIDAIRRTWRRLGNG
jgi:DNA-binding transcriptional regulator YhcF (GntR family)